MAIAFNNSASVTITGTSGSVNINCSGSNRYLLVMTGANATSVSHNSVAMTNIRTYTPVFPSGTNCPPIKIWGLHNPDTGSQAIDVTNPSGATYVAAVCYTGVAPGGIEAYYEEDSANNQVSTWTGTVTTITPNSWRLMFVCLANNSAGFTAGGGTTERIDVSGISSNPLGIYDSNSAITTPASGTLTVTPTSGSGFFSSVTVSLSPVFESSGSFLQYF